MKQFNVLDKFLYNKYINRFESELKVNPKAFWNYIRSKRGGSNIPTCMHFNGKSSQSLTDSVNFFAEFFKSNFVTDDEFVNTSVNFPPHSSLDFGSLTLTELDISIGISCLKSSMKSDNDGLSSYF